MLYWAGNLDNGFVLPKGWQRIASVSTTTTTTTTTTKIESGLSMSWVELNWIELNWIELN